MFHIDIRNYSYFREKIRNKNECFKYSSQSIKIIKSAEIIELTEVYDFAYIILHEYANNIFKNSEFHWKKNIGQITRDSSDVVQL